MTFSLAVELLHKLVNVDLILRDLLCYMLFEVLLNGSLFNDCHILTPVHVPLRFHLFHYETSSFHVLFQIEFGLEQLGYNDFGVPQLTCFLLEIFSILIN